jgi:hypothetical protein
VLSGGRRWSKWFSNCGGVWCESWRNLIKDTKIKGLLLAMSVQIFSSISLF